MYRTCRERRTGRYPLIVAWVLLLAASVVVSPAYAQAPEFPRFTLAVSSAYARSQPGLASEPVFSLFRGQSRPVIGQTTDGQWLLLSNRAGPHGWVNVGYGEVDGSLEHVPVVAEPPPPEAAGLPLRPQTVAGAGVVPEVPPGVVPEVSDRARAIYARGRLLGNNPNAFAKIGDCNSENGRFLVMFDDPGSYQLGAQYEYLQATVDYYRGSWERISVAAHSGFSPAAVLDSTWSNPLVCEPGEGPLQCEYRLLRPSVAIVALGTHSGPTLEDFERDMRAVIAELEANGVVPILATKADNVEGGDRINAITRALAQEYELPLWDFHVAAQQLPNDGLASDGIHLTFARPLFDEPWNMHQGWPWRNLTALLALDAVRHGLEQPPAAATSLEMLERNPKGYSVR